jgi:hypothetical protein
MSDSGVCITLWRQWNFGRKVKDCHVKAVFLNNAGIGKNQAGISGLAHYEAENILACAVDHNSAEIGIARDTWENGIISHTNNWALAVGIQIGDSVQEAVAKIGHLFNLPSSAQINRDFESLVDEKKENIAR